MARKTVKGLDASNKRNGIVAAAVELFAERGIAQTSMRQVAGQVGITDATLYYYFAGKDALVEAAFNATSFHTADLERALAQAATSVSERLLAVGRAFFDVLAANPPWTRLVIRESLHGGTADSGMPRLLASLGRGRIAMLARALANDTGLPVKETELAAAHFFHACSGFWIGECLIADTPPTPSRSDAYLAHVAATLAAGLQARAVKGQG